VGIVDDVSHTSLAPDADFITESGKCVRAMLFGLGADGTVGANKNSIKIIAEETENDGQGYFVYDSKKAGAITISHLRFGPRKIRSTYLIKRANFVACHQFSFLDKYDMTGYAVPGGIFLLNAPFGPHEIWGHLPREVQQDLIEKRLKFYVIDAVEVARKTGMGGRINTIMQTCFFAVSGVLPREEAIAKIKQTIKKTYEKKGMEVVQKNYAAVDETLANMHEVRVPAKVTATKGRPSIVSAAAPDFVKRVSAIIIEQKGDSLPVSAFPPDGTWPTATSQWEKRNIAIDIPIWDEAVCIQDNKCVLICPHAAIRAKVYDPALLATAPPTFKAVDYKAGDFKGLKYTIQVAPEDCTGCGLCVTVCPAKDKSNPRHKALEMAPQMPLREPEAANYEFFLALPEPDRTKLKIDSKRSQFLQPLFEYSGACAACGETPYVKLLTQLFGDRALVGNATGCSSIYGGNLPTTPYAVDAAGRGPAWSNSLFEDNAEFSLGFRLAVDAQQRLGHDLLRGLSGKLGDELVTALIEADQKDELGIHQQRERVVALRAKLAGIPDPAARRLDAIADYLVKKSVWAVGGDGWAYDIGYGGLDHVMAMNRDVNILVLDTEVYSNTGGQASKATPMGAAAKFATAGKALGKKDLGLMAMSYGHVYVARVAMGAREQQTVRAFMEADSYRGTSLIIAYCHCIAHGYDLAQGTEHQKLAVEAGIWPLYRFDPRRISEGQPPLILDAEPTGARVSDLTKTETRFRMVEKLDPKRFQHLMAKAQMEATQRFAVYRHLAGLTIPKDDGDAGAAAPADEK